MGHSRPNLPIRAMSAIALIATKLPTSPVVRFVPLLLLRLCHVSLNQQQPSLLIAIQRVDRRVES